MAAANPLRAVLDVLRKDPGFENEAQRIGQVALLVFLKVLDERESAKEAADKGYVSPVPKKLRWRQWANRQEEYGPTELLNYLRHIVLARLAALEGADPLSATVRSVVEPADVQIKNGEVLRRALDILDQAETDSLVDPFEEMLSGLPGSKSGSFFTPPPLARLMVGMVDPAPGESVFDPACGTGGLLVAAYEHMLEKGRRAKAAVKGAVSIRGMEIESIPYRMAVTRLMLRNVAATVEHGNALRARPSTKETKGHDVILCTPPFAEAPDTILTLTFLDHIISALPKGGRAAVVVSDRLLFETENRLIVEAKRQLLTECDLQAIVRLPSGVFNPHTLVRSNILIFTKGRSTKEVRYYDLLPPSGEKGYTKQRPLTQDDLSPVLHWWKTREESSRAWKLSAKEIRASDYDLDHHASNPDEHRWPTRAIWLRLSDFRRFDNLLLELPKSGPAVIIGENGAGKSTLLDALGMLFTFFTTGARSLEEPSALWPEHTDIQSGKKEYVVRLLVRAGDDEQAWEMSGNAEGPVMLTGSSAPVALIDGLRRDPKRSIPVLCLYPATRGTSRSPDVRNHPLPDARLEAYDGAFYRGFGPFDDFARWFREEEDIENESRLRSSPDDRNPRLDSVRRALERFLSELGDSQFSNMRVERLSAKEAERSGAKATRLVIDKAGHSLSIEQFSEGERNTILLAADIARRLGIANPGLDNPLQGEGIVLIDEIDLHLHPAWQRNIVPALCATFPRVQFIVSTHSPQVLSRIPRENVFILEGDKLVRTTPHTYGRDANTILAEVMGVPERPKEMQEKIRRASTLLDEERLEEAKAALEELTTLLGDDDTMVVRLRTLASFLEDGG